MIDLSYVAGKSYRLWHPMLKMVNHSEIMLLWKWRDPLGTIFELTVGSSRWWTWRQSCQVIQSSLYCRRDWWWRWQVSSLGLEAVLVRHISKPDLLAVRWRVRRRALCHLSLDVGVSRVLQKSAFLGYDAVSSLKATTRIVRTLWFARRQVTALSCRQLSVWGASILVRVTNRYWLFYGVSGHDSCHWELRQMQAFYVVNLPCLETR